MLLNFDFSSEEPNSEVPSQLNYNRGKIWINDVIFHSLLLQATMLRKPSWKRMRHKEREFGMKKVAPLAQEEDDHAETRRKRSYFNFRKKTPRQRPGKSLSRWAPS